MYELIKTAHSYLAYIVLLTLLFAISNAIIGFASDKKFTLKDYRISMFALIFSHVQLVIGIVLYFISVRGYRMIKVNGMGLESEPRLLALEHPVIGILAIILITIGWSKHKKEETFKGAYKKIIIFYSLGLLLILSRLPWKDWWNLY
ncbi:MAG: hypothetical protein AAF611_15710 [Bacteroidota bacterium]